MCVLVRVVRSMTQCLSESSQEAKLPKHFERSAVTRGGHYACSPACFRNVQPDDLTEIFGAIPKECYAATPGEADTTHRLIGESNLEGDGRGRRSYVRDRYIWQPAISGRQR